MKSKKKGSKDQSPPQDLDLAYELICNTSENEVGRKVVQILIGGSNER